MSSSDPTAPGRDRYSSSFRGRPSGRGRGGHGFPPVFASTSDPDSVQSDDLTGPRAPTDPISLPNNEDEKKSKDTLQSPNHLVKSRNHRRRRRHPDSCLAYDNFRRQLDHMRGCERLLQNSLLCDRGCSPFRHKQVSPVLAELRRGELIRLLTAWEAFCGDLLIEAFGYVVTDDMDLAQIRHIMPGIEQTVRAELALYGPYDAVMNPKAFRDHIISKLKEDSLHDLSVPILDKTEDRSKGFFTAFKRLFGDNAANFTMAKLAAEKNKPQNILKFYTERGAEETFSLTCDNDYHNLLRLFYGMRCVFAHGNTRSTMRGVLHHFARAKISNDVINTWAQHQYEVLEKSTPQAPYVVSHETLVNAQRFIQRLACNCMQWVIYVIQTKFAVKMWGGFDENTLAQQSDYFDLDGMFNNST